MPTELTPALAIKPGEMNWKAPGTDADPPTSNEALSGCPYWIVPASGISRINGTALFTSTETKVPAVI